jgi:hypothetical protein
VGAATGQRAKTDNIQTRIIRPRVLSERIKSVVVAAIIAAVHQADTEFLLPASAFGPNALINNQGSDRAY